MLWKWYNRVLKLHPWKTQLFTTGFLMGSSDIISQTAIEHRRAEKIELIRVGRFALLGVCFVGPVLRVWYGTLESLFGAVGRTVGLKKMLVDQCMFCPCFVGSFLTIAGLTQFQPWPVIMKKLNEDYLTIMKTNYMLWPAAQLITFYIIPLQFRVIFVSCVALVWNTYLASQANRNYQQNDKISVSNQES